LRWRNQPHQRAIRRRIRLDRAHSAQELLVLVIAEDQQQRIVRLELRRDALEIKIFESSGISKRERLRLRRARREDVPLGARLQIGGSLERLRQLAGSGKALRSEEHTSELQSPCNLVC